jgi:hypothetical protein
MLAGGNPMEVGLKLQLYGLRFNMFITCVYLDYVRWHLGRS